MKNIETSEEFANRMLGKEQYPTDVPYFMIQFAKLHVEAALKAASEKAKCKLKESLICTNQEKESGYKILKTNSHIIPDRDSILNAYPLTLIK